MEAGEGATHDGLAETREDLFDDELHLLDHLLHLDASYHTAHTPGELIERADGDVATLARFFSRFVVYILGNAVLILGMLLTALWAWAIERTAYRPLRGSFRLAPLISAIGMSIFLSNFVQVTQGPRNKPIPPLINQVYTVGGISISLKQIVIVIVTALLLAIFWYLVNRTALGRAQRACEQDRKMAALLGIDVDKTISITFIMGAALAAVAGTLYLMYYGVVSFSDGFVPGAAGTSTGERSATGVAADGGSAAVRVSAIVRYARTNAASQLRGTPNPWPTDGSDTSSVCPVADVNAFVRAGEQT